IEAALKEAEEAMKSDDKAKIESATQALAQAAHKLAEQMYAQEQGKQQGSESGAGQQSTAGSANAGNKDEGDVVDAEYEEVKDKK
ncbi:MAG: molecular chaperone DnaK, partial [Betaproteobacteria bacterium]